MLSVKSIRSAWCSGRDYLCQARMFIWCVEAHSSGAAFYCTFVQKAIDSAMSLLLCHQIASQASQHKTFRDGRHLGQLLCPTARPRSGELRTQKLKSHPVKPKSLNFLPLKPGVDKYIAIHATLTARDFFLAYSYPSGPFTRIFSNTSPDFSCVGCG